MTVEDLFDHSQQLLLNMKMGKSPDELMQKLEAIPTDDLKQQLNDDDKKKAFWINCYNAYFLILRKLKGKKRPEIYKDEAVKIAGLSFSLDDIEHGILRKYRHKLSLGFLPNFCTSRIIKQLAVDKLDYRIHFALNCGAASCPPIAFYTPDKIEQQLEMATQSFLQSETTLEKDKQEIHVSRLFKWYLGDFGGTDGIRQIIKDKLNHDVANYKVIYSEYSWEESLDNFAS